MGWGGFYHFGRSPEEIGHARRPDFLKSFDDVTEGLRPKAFATCGENTTNSELFCGWLF